MRGTLVWYLFAYLPALPVLVFGYPMIVLAAWFFTMVIAAFIQSVYVRIIIVTILLVLRICVFDTFPSTESWCVQGYVFAAIAVGMCLSNRKNDGSKSNPE